METGFEILKYSTTVATKGLKIILGNELVIVRAKDSDGLFESNLLNCMAEYIAGSGMGLKGGDKVTLMSWIYELHELDEHIELFELSEDGETFVRGCEYSYGLVSRQEYVCEQFDETPQFVGTDQMVAITEDVLSGAGNLNAVRYKASGHMSGWWVTSDQYDGNIKSLITVHMGHVLAARVDLRSFLALPPGYRLRVEDEVNVWFDPNVLKEA